MLSTQEPGPPAHAFDVHVVAQDGHPVVVLQGEIDLAAADRLDAAITEAIAAGPRITVDLSGTSFMDSTGVNALIDAHHRLGQVPEAVVLRDPSPTVRRVLAVAGIEDLFTVQIAGAPAGPGAPDRRVGSSARP